MEKYALIVAAGSGQRMKAAQPKQFLLLKDKPVLMHTIERFAEADPGIKIIVVLPEEHQNTWKILCGKHHFHIIHELVSGGASRSESVRNGLRSVPLESLVAIHDGVRPFPPIKTILDSFIEAAERGNAIASIRLKDSIRHIIIEGNRSVDRENYRLIQTPQTFQSSLIKGWYNEIDEMPSPPKFDDDAAIADHFNYPVHLIEGAFTNLKITTPDDLIIATALLEEGI